MEIEVSMKKLLLKTILFATPFIIFSIVILKIDPYNYFTYDPRQIRIKLDIARKLNYALWKLIEFKRNSSANILLGDSRMGILNSEIILKNIGEKYYNFSYGGGTLPEMIDTFWFATTCTRIRNAYFGISFNHFNSYNNDNRVISAIQVLNNSLLYLVNRNVLNAAFKMIGTRITKKSSQIEKPAMDREKFWNHQLNVSARRYYENYKYPKKWYNELQRISEYCRANGIQLKFLILPTHAQMQAKIVEYDLSSEYEAYIQDLSKLAIVYDFNIKNSWTEERNNFDDPYHFKFKLAQELINEIWGRKRHWVQITSTENSSNLF